MQIPEFLKEIVWSFFPPRYKQLADKPFRKSLTYLSKVLLIAFILAGLLYVPKLFLLKDVMQDEFSKFSSFRLDGEVAQTDRISIPHHNPWLVIDLNSNVTLTKEIFVIDKETVQYRFLNTRSIQREQLKDFSANKAKVSGFLTTILVMLFPGIAILLYVRMWLKYLLMIFVFGTLFFIIMELSNFRLKWKQMLNIAAHSLTLVIFIEVISAALTTAYLIPVMRFLGVSIYAVTTLIFAFLMVVGIVGCSIEARRKK
jgi:hypothetical protein